MPQVAEAAAATPGPETEREGSARHRTSNFFFANVTAMGDKCWRFVESDMNHHSDFFGFVETHASAANWKKWDNKTRLNHFILVANRARPLARIASQSRQQ
eukprot:8418338-Pyramimonas_sp.AAC.1